ncbi:MAG TPA: GMC oxidoreductase [Dongiaceae bacterium]|nr:GMC oxidoreductase [Dongiaceae bacterium]
MASRLAERGFSVLLLEAGDLKSEDMNYLKIPALHPKASERNGLSWRYMVEHYTDLQRAKLDSKRCPGPAGCVTPNGTLNGVFYPRGAAVGGSTAVNAMISVLPHDSDWNHIASITGDSSWSAPAMREYFIRIERNENGRGNDQGHGTNGWYSINHNAFVTTLPNGEVQPTLPVEVLGSYTAMVTGGSLAAEIGTTDYGLVDFPLKDVNRLRATSIPPITNIFNLNDPGYRIAPLPKEPLGLYQVPVGVNRYGQRSSVADRIMGTLANHYPLTLQTKSLVTKVLFDTASTKPKAIGVQYLSGANLYRADRLHNPAAAMPVATSVYARKEVILSAGAFNTPQLLMLSGIGPSAVLNRVGIPVRVALPGVGQNLQDRYEVPVIVKRRTIAEPQQPINFPALTTCSFNPAVSDNCMTQWLYSSLGVYTQPGAVESIVKKSTEMNMQLQEINDTNPEKDPDLYVFGLGGTFKGYYPGYSGQTFDPDNQFTWLVLKGHSSNKGAVELRSADPRDTPLINFKYFGDPAKGVSPSGDHLKDLDAVVKGVRLARLASAGASVTEALGSGGIYEEVWPGANVTTDDQLRQYAMNESWGHHASCTAKIGSATDSMAVLDSRFRVRGVDRLRVVDASVFPRIPGFFPVVAIYMMSEKAADAITADAPLYW